MLNFIRTTSTQTGLVVTAYFDRNEYPTRLKPNPQLISSLRLTHGKVLPRWNLDGTTQFDRICEVIFAPALSHGNSNYSDSPPRAGRLCPSRQVIDPLAQENTLWELVGMHDNLPAADVCNVLETEI
jgi:hypothetical protein